VVSDAEADIGCYALSKDERVAIAPWDVGPGGDSPSFLNLASGRFGLLRSAAGGCFVSGPSLLVEEPVEITIAFERDDMGAVNGLLWQERDQPARRAGRINIRREDIAFTSGDLLLAGTLLLPTTEPPYPAIVFVHGSGPSRRESFGALPYLFAADGFAVLAYDKRGSGGSTGDWRRASFDELAHDVLAAVSMLTQRPEIDPARLGLYDSSQGGWIAPLAASRSAAIAFIVVICGSGVTPAQQMLHLHEQRLRHHGFGDDDISAVCALLAMRNRVARTSQEWDAFETAVRRAQARPWFSLIDTPPLSPPRQSWAWRFWAMTNDYDPAPALQRVHCPVLALFGEMDPFIPAQASIAVMEPALAEAGNRDVTFRVLPRAYHSLIETETGTEEEMPQFKRFTPGFIETVLGWLRERMA